MKDNSKEPTARIVIQDVPISHVKALRIGAAKDGHRFLTPFVRKLIAEWVEKQAR